MGDQLLSLPLTERSVHPCVNMQRIVTALAALGVLWAHGGSLIPLMKTRERPAPGGPLSSAREWPDSGGRR
jgi:hypothetical protein